MTSIYGTIAVLYAKYITGDACCIPSTAEATKISMISLLELANQVAVDNAKQNIPGKKISVLGTNAAVLSAVPTKLTFLAASNDNADEAYIKFYDQITVPNPAVDVPVWSLIVPGRVEGAGSNLPLPPKGIDFVVGLAYIFTTGIADTDATGVAANDITMNYALEV